MRDGQTTTSEDRATKLLICEALSFAIVKKNCPKFLNVSSSLNGFFHPLITIVANQFTCNVFLASMFILRVFGSMLADTGLIFRDHRRQLIRFYKISHDDAQGVCVRNVISPILLDSLGRGN